MHAFGQTLIDGFIKVHQTLTGAMENDLLPWKKLWGEFLRCHK